MNHKSNQFTEKCFIIKNVQEVQAEDKVVPVLK
jgi:hypothetical protein